MNIPDYLEELYEVIINEQDTDTLDALLIFTKQLIAEKEKSPNGTATV